VLLGLIILVFTVLIGWFFGFICILAGLLIGAVLLLAGLIVPDKKSEDKENLSIRDIKNLGIRGALKEREERSKKQRMFRSRKDIPR